MSRDDLRSERQKLKQAKIECYVNGELQDGWKESDQGTTSQDGNTIVADETPNEWQSSGTWALNTPKDGFFTRIIKSVFKRS